MNVWSLTALALLSSISYLESVDHAELHDWLLDQAWHCGGGGNFTGLGALLHLGQQAP